MMNDTEPKFDLRDWLSAAARRRRPIIYALAGGLLLTICPAVFLPAYYLSSGTILIEQQELPSELVRSTVTSYADQRVQTISQRVMTTKNLQGIIDRYDLYPEMRNRKTREEIIGRMREDIGLNMISADVIDPRSGVPREATIAFSVSYTSRGADKAVRVANELTTLYLNENLTERTRLAQDASSFLTAEADRLSAEMTGLEDRLAGFKEKNGDALPELATMNLTMLDRTEQDLRQMEARLASLDSQRVYLEAQLVQNKPNSVMVGDSGERITDAGGPPEGAALTAGQCARAVRRRSPGCDAHEARDLRARNRRRRCCGLQRERHPAAARSRADEARRSATEVFGRTSGSGPRRARSRRPSR